MSAFHSETQNIASYFKINKHFRHGGATPTIPLKAIIYCYMSCVYPPIKRCVCVCPLNDHLALVRASLSLYMSVFYKKYDT